VPPKFWDIDYKIEPTFNHVATFLGDCPRELGDLALKKRHLQQYNIKAVPAELKIAGRP